MHNLAFAMFRHDQLDQIVCIGQESLGDVFVSARRAVKLFLFFFRIACEDPSSG